MAFDGVAPIVRVEAIALPTMKANAVLFRRGEGVALAVGALAIGAATGLTLFFMFGRVAPWMPVAAALAIYGFAMQLAGLSLRDVIRTQAPGATVLFSLHLAALAAWPFAIMWAAHSLQLGLGLLALLSFAVFLIIARVPASAVYRSTTHVSLIAAIAAYQAMWTALGA